MYYCRLFPLLASSVCVIIAIIISSSCGCVDGKVVGGAVLPHGDFVAAPELIHGANGSAELHRAALELSSHLRQLSPDVVVLITPHGIELNDDFVLYRNTNLSGFAMLGQDLHNESIPEIKEELSVQTHTAIVDEILAQFGGRGRNLTGMLAFGDGYPLPLGWGEVVPLGFLRDVVGDGGKGKVVVISVPLRRYTDSVAMIPEMLGLGRDLYKLLNDRSERILMMVSGDLAHTHLASGPYGYTDEAQPFDDACGEWAQTLDDRPLLTTAAGLVGKALSCGFSGMVMMHGALTQASGGARGDWLPKLWSIHHPTYYGMMVASFLPA